MRKILCLTLPAIFFILNSGFSQWQWLNPKPSGFDNNNVVFTSSQQGFIINSNGDLLATDNAGAIWEVTHHFSIGNTRMSIKDSTGIITGEYTDSHFYISTDNGITWEDKTGSGVPTGVSMISIVSRDTLFLGTSQGKIYRSDDRGNTWFPFDCHNALFALFFVNSKVGYAGCTATTLLKTEDGGATWKAPSADKSVPTHTRAMFFTDLLNGCVAQDDSQAFITTTDGGKTWGNYVAAGGNMRSMTFVNKDTGYAVGDGYSVARTTDAGKSWTFLPLPQSAYDYAINSVYFTDGANGYVAGPHGSILKTTNSGDSWQPNAPSYLDVKGLSFPEPAVGYALMGGIYKTTDSGNVWTALPLSLQETIYGGTPMVNQVHFKNKDTGFIMATEPARAFTTDDGGLTWKKTFLNDTFNYVCDHVSSVSFINSSVGFADVLDDYGNVNLYKTKDAGHTWQLDHRTVNRMNFSQIFFLSEAVGYAVNYGTLYKTTDSAHSWQQVFYNNYGEDIHSLYFSDENNGYIAGNYSLLSTTKDGGKTWTQVNTDSQAGGFASVAFYSKQIGYAIDIRNILYRTLDSGNTWQMQPRYDNDGSLAGFGTDSSFYLTGSGGEIVKSSIASYAIEHLIADSLTSCSGRLSASITTILSRADSLQFEYGVSGFANRIAASPDTVVNTQQTISGNMTGLQPATSYQLRIRMLYRGKIVYSEPLSFTTLPAPAAPVITAAGAASRCEGDSVVLHSSAATGNQWYVNDTLTNRASSPVYMAYTGGSYAVRDSGGCASALSSPVVLDFTPIPAKPVITVAAAGSLSSSATTGNQWYRNDTLLAGATGQTYMPDATGEYSVQVNTNGCLSAVADSYNFVIEPTANTNGMWNGEVSYYPNPLTDRLVIQNTHNRNLGIRLVSSQGVAAKQMQLRTASGTFYLQDLSKGMYVLAITDADTGETQSRIVIKQ